MIRLVSLIALMGTLMPGASALASKGEGFLFGSKPKPGVGAEAFRVDSRAQAAGAAPASRLSPPTDSSTIDVPSPTSSTSEEVPVLYQPIGFACDDGSTAGFRFTDIYYRRCAVEAPVAASDGPERRRPRGPSIEEVRRSVIDRAIALAPSPDLRVAPGRIGLTGLPSFFWLDEEPQAITASAGVRGISVTATATPSHYVWSFGDGDDLTTTDPGRRWTKRRGGSLEHTYEAKGRYDLTATIVWDASWRLNGGPSQPLGTFSTSDSVEYPVREVIAFLTSR